LKNIFKKIGRILGHFLIRTFLELCFVTLKNVKGKIESSKSKIEKPELAYTSMKKPTHVAIITLCP